MLMGQFNEENVKHGWTIMFHISLSINKHEVLFNQVKLANCLGIKGSQKIISHNVGLNAIIKCVCVSMSLIDGLVILVLKKNLLKARGTGLMHMHGIL
jgi:hypothetical protein